jgi:hypothetical protein
MPIQYAEPTAEMIPDEDDKPNEYREASLHFLRIMNMGISFVAESKSPHVAAWSVAYGVGLGICQGKSITDRAAELKVSPQALSKQIKAFAEKAGLPPSTYMYKK